MREVVTPRAGNARRPWSCCGSAWRRARRCGTRRPRSSTVGGAMPSTPTPPRWLEPVNRVLVALPRTGPAMRSATVLPACPHRARPEVRQAVEHAAERLELDGKRYLMGGFPVADGTPDEFAQLAGTC